LFVIQKNKKTMIKEKGKEICQRVLDTNKKIIIVEKSMKPRYDENGYFLTNKKTH